MLPDPGFLYSTMPVANEKAGLPGGAWLLGRCQLVTYIILVCKGLMFQSSGGVRTLTGNSLNNKVMAYAR